MKKGFTKKCYCERPTGAQQSVTLSFRGCETAEESHEIKTKRFFGRSCRFDLNHKFNANPLNDGRSFAFTLAEVLITLTIIGVIAAITIPNLMQKHRKHEIEVGVKSAYSIIQNAIKLSVAENGPVDSWDYSSTTVFTEKYIIPYLKVARKCGRNSSSAPHGCFHYDSSLSFGNNGTWFYLTGSSAQYESRNYYNMKLQNGMDLGIQVTGRTDLASIYNPISFVFDVNGSKGPTKAGVDVFAFSMDSATGKFRTGTVDTGWYGDIKTTKNVFESPHTGGCNLTSSQSGMACARVLEYNSWSFPEDYPIKKF